MAVLLFLFLEKPADALMEAYVSSDAYRASYWILTYAGYAGDLSPKLAFELLKGKESVALIDVRPEARDCNFF